MLAQASPGVLMDQQVMYDRVRCWAEGIDIRWQQGPVKGRPLNGARIEGVIRAAIYRLEDYQRGPTACDQNRQAIEHLNAAIHQLQQRTNERYRRGVIGTELP